MNDINKEVIEKDMEEMAKGDQQDSQQLNFSNTNYVTRGEASKDQHLNNLKTWIHPFRGRGRPRPRLH